MARRMLSLVTSLALFAGTATLQAPAMAQEQQTLEEITVTAPRITREERDAFRYGKTVVAEGSATVDAADLDLSKTAGLLELENRVEKAAEEVCKDLAEEMPFGQPSTPVCIARAVADTMAEVKNIVEP